MSADEQGLVRSELIQAMLRKADDMESSSNSFLAVTGSIVRREAHLAEARCLAAVQDGLPADTARLLAQDDMGFQLARAASVAWGAD